jgi:DNA replicative helicase MCM subunit Mcm2 (Cdc46/Mcm family)
MQIYGLFLVKLAVAITLIGGCRRTDGSGTHIRGECHMLLIGDPGTGKSQVGTAWRAAGVQPRVLWQCGCVRPFAGHPCLCSILQVMKFAARVAPRAVVTTGRGTTGVGGA